METCLHWSYQDTIIYFFQDVFKYFTKQELNVKVGLYDLGTGLFLNNVSYSFV